MSSLSKGEVSYGNPGPGLYVTPNKEWHFPRSYVDDTYFHVIEQKTISPGQLRSGPEDPKPKEPQEHGNPARVRKRKFNALLNTFPELIPGAHTVPTLEQTSQAIDDLTSIYEPLASDYLAYGVVDYEETTKVPAHLRASKILASVTGASRHVVRLSLVGEVKRVIHRVFGGVCFMKDDYHYQEHVVFWRGTDRTAIQQLCFSKVTTDSSLLAVRRHNSIDILKPIVRKESMYKSKLAESEIGTGERWSASSLDSNWLLHVSLDHSNDLSIIDLAFHPHVGTEFAILNAKGEVMVLEVEERYRASKRWNIKHLAQISMFNIVKEDPLDDAWGAILWFKDGESILGARRNALVACKLSNFKPSTVNISLELLDQQSSILDLRHEGVLSDCCFVLTTSSLTIVSQSPSRDESSISLQSDYRSLVSIIHHRNSDDTSMRLSIQTYDHYIFVLIYSRIVPLITGYKIVLDQRTKEFKHITDPFRLVLPDMMLPSFCEADASLSKAGRSVSYLTIRAIEIDTSGHDILSDAYLFHVLTLDKAFELTQMIVMAQSSSSCVENFSLGPLPPQAALLDAKAHLRTGKAFVAESDSESEEEESRSQPFKYHVQLEKERESLPFSNDFTFLTNELNSRLDASYAESQSVASFETALESLLSKWSSVSPGTHILSDFMSTSLPVDSIDAVSRRMIDLLDTIREAPAATQILSSHEVDSNDLSQKIKLSILPSEPMLRDLQDNDQVGKVLLVPIYEKLLRLYLHALPSLAPLNARVWLEKCIRRAAMQLFMTSHGVQAFNSHDTVIADDMRESMTDTSESQQLSLPTRIRTLDPNLPNFNQQPERADTLRLSSRSSTPAQRYDSSSQQTLSNAIEPSENIGATLAKYIEFRTVSPIHRTMRRAVPEWHVGVAPTGLEWKSMSRSASQESLASGRSSKQRKKDKGKGRAVSEVGSNVSALESDYLQSTDFIKQEPHQTAAFDLDDALLGSQISTFPSDQALPQMGQQHYAITSRSQSPPAHSSQIASQVPNTRDPDHKSGQPRLRKNVPSKKRPSGFR